MEQQTHRARVGILLALSIGVCALPTTTVLQADVLGRNPALVHAQELMGPLVTAITPASETWQEQYRTKAVNALAATERQRRHVRLDIHALLLLDASWNESAVSMHAAASALPSIPCFSAGLQSSDAAGLCTMTPLSLALLHASSDVRGFATADAGVTLLPSEKEAILVSIRGRMAELTSRLHVLDQEEAEDNRLLEGYFAIVPGAPPASVGTIEHTLLVNAGMPDAGSGSAISLAHWPVEAPISTTFLDPEYAKEFKIEHLGIDLTARLHTPVTSMADGVVVLAHSAGSGGYSYVLVAHQGGFATVYGHLSSIAVTNGQHVEAGETLGKSGGVPGADGAGRMTTGAHLHFEVWQDGVRINPLSVLPPSKWTALLQERQAKPIHATPWQT